MTVHVCVCVCVCVKLLTVWYAFIYVTLFDNRHCTTLLVSHVIHTGHRFLYVSHQC